ncbi:MAG: hypothetical protein JO279_15885 [Verrucomicrobia bacterium]|nr:hypothetical protein [Verrucomicrobiota bacterium]
MADSCLYSLPLGRLCFPATRSSNTDGHWWNSDRGPGQFGKYSGYTLAGGDDFTSLSIVNVANPLNKCFPTIDYQNGTRGTMILLSYSYDSDPYNSGHQDSNRGVALGSNTTYRNGVLPLRFAHPAEIRGGAAIPVTDLVH